MTLEKIKQLNQFVKLAPLCEATGMNVETLKARLKRKSPEITKEEGTAIVAILEKIIKDFKNNTL